MFGAADRPSASVSARRVVRSSADAQRHTAASSSGTVVTIPPIHMIVAAVRWSASASADPSRRSYVGISGLDADSKAIPSTDPAAPTPNATPTPRDSGGTPRPHHGRPEQDGATKVRDVLEFVDQPVAKGTVIDGREVGGEQDEHEHHGPDQRGLAPPCPAEAAAGGRRREHARASSGAQWLSEHEQRRSHGDHQQVLDHVAGEGPLGKRFQPW